MNAETTTPKIPNRHFLTLEMLTMFGGTPIALVLLDAPRWAMHACLWGCALYAFVWLPRQLNFNWRKLWHGVGWERRYKTFAAARFLLLVPALTGITLYIAPDRFLSFPRERPEFWALVMLLYPVLSVLPQEFVFRSFFFPRYAPLFPKPAMLIIANAVWFGFAHIMFHNWIAPTLCLIGGLMFGLNFERHRSLKWVTIEHAAYGCLIFTLGLGRYFFAGAMR